MQFDYRPTLQDDRVLLRPLTPDDFPDLYSVANDPLIWEQHPASDRHEEPVFRQFFQEAVDSPGVLIAIDTNSGNVIGSSRFHAFDAAKSEVEIGWTFLARSHWGGSYNGSMKKLMIRHAFRFVTHVVLMVGVDNIRSQRAVEKVGGTRTGLSPDAYGNKSFRYEIPRDSFQADHPLK